jgi:hypothetical protein
MDLDRVLVAAGNNWRDSLPPAPDLRDAAARAVAQPDDHVPSRRWVSAVAAACLVGACAAVIAYMTGHGGGSSRPRHAPASVQVAGKSVPYAGSLSWTDATIDSRHPRLVRVFVNVDRVHASDVCYAIAERPVVTEQTPHDVTIFVAGYAPKAGWECPGLAHGPSPVNVHLRQPLAGRSLIDATTGASHPVLDTANLPHPRDLPAACRPTLSLSWDQTTGVVTRVTGTDLCHVITVIGTTEQIDKLPQPNGSQQQPTRIAGHPATVWRYDDVRNGETVVQWESRPGRTIRLAVNAEPAQLKLSTNRSIAIARSIR